MLRNKFISTSFAPNFQKDDVVFATKLLFSSPVKQPKTKLCEFFHTLFPKTQTSFFSSARAGIMYSLIAMGVKEGDEVLLQAFTCVAVCDAIVWAGAKPVFIDIDQNTLNMNPSLVEAHITPKTKAIIIQYTLGNNAGVKEIITIAQKHNIFVIEDRAHLLDDAPLLGDCAIFSFGRDKAFSSVFGGAVVCRNEEVSKKLVRSENNLTTTPAWFVIQQLLYPLLYSISLSLYTIGVGKGILWFASKIGVLSRAVYPHEANGGKPAFLHFHLHEKLASLAYYQLKKMTMFNKHRQTLVRMYAEALKKHIPTSYHIDQSYLRMPLWVKSKGHLLAEAKKQGIHLGNWYRGPIDPPYAAQGPFNYAPCPIAEEAARCVVNLPTHVNISSNDAKRIIVFMQGYFSKHPSE